MTEDAGERPGVQRTGGERVRLFVALDLPEPVRAALLEWRAAQAPLQGLRLTSPAALHATLCFPGWRPTEEIAPVAESCATATGGCERPRLRLGESLWLPPRRPRVLSVALEDPTGVLGRLQASLSAALSKGGWYEPESRPYLAHVTVARMPARSRVRAVELPSPRALEFNAPSVTLYRSRLERGGARYEALATTLLQE